MGYFSYDFSGVDMMGLKQPQQPIHISYPNQICQNPGENSAQYQSFLQVANALATEMKFFSDSYNKSLSTVEGQLYKNLDFSPEASVWDLITGVQGENIHAEDASVVDDINNNFNWDDIKNIGGSESYDTIINKGELYSLSDEQAFDLMCSMLDSKERVFGAYQSIFGKAEDLSNDADVIGNINTFLANNNTIDPHNMGLISLLFSLDGQFMDALSKFSTNSAFMEKVQNYIDNGGLSGDQQTAANALKNEWTDDMRRWDQVNGTSVNCHPGAFQLLLKAANDQASGPIGLIQGQFNSVMEAYTASNGDLSSFSDALNAIVPALTSDQISAITTAFSSAEKTFLQELNTQLHTVTGLNLDQQDQVVQAYEDSNGDPTLFGSLLLSIQPPLTADQISAIQAALVTAENNYKAFNPDFTVGTDWYDYFHYEMISIGNKDAVKSLTSDMFNRYLDNKYKTDEADYEDKKNDRIDEEFALMKIEAKHRAEAKARMNALLKRKSSSSRVAAAKSVKGSASKSRVSSAKRSPAVAPGASHPVISAPVVRHAQSAAMAAGFAARNVSAAAIAAGASKKNNVAKASGSSSSPATQAVEAQAKKHAKNENKVI